MARRKPALLHVGIKKYVLALDADTGVEVWRTELKSGDFVVLHRAGDRLFAANHGEIFCLDPQTGEVRWHNKLPGLGWGIATFATEPVPGQSATADTGVAAAMKKIRDQQQAAAAAAT